MKEKVSKYLSFIPGIMFGIVAILNFFDHKVAMGFTYVCLAISFCSIDFSKNKTKNHK